MEVFPETGLRVLGSRGRAVKIDILVTEVGADANDVPLVRHQIDQCKLPIETGDGGIRLADLLAGLDGKANRWRVGKLEANDRVSDPRRSPVVDREIDPGDLGEAHGAGVPARRVIRLRAVFAIADVVQRYIIAI